MSGLDNLSAQPGGDDPLDQLLQEARWPQVEETAETRLMQRWRDISAAQRRRDSLLSWAAVVAVAACLAVATFVGWQAVSSNAKPVAQPDQARPDDRRPAIKPAPRTPNNSAATPTAHRPRRPRVVQVVVSSDASAEPTISRPPNELEELMFAALDRRRQPPVTARPPGPAPALAKNESTEKPHEQPAKNLPKPGSKKSPRKEAEDKALATVQKVVRLLATDSKADPAAVAAALRLAVPDSERRLLALLNTSADSERIVVLRLLREIGSPAAVPGLLQASAASKLHAAAIDALSRLADSSLIVELAAHEENLDLQRTLLAALLARGDVRSTVFYLDFVQNSATSQTALAAAEIVRNPPMGLLFAALEDSFEPRRFVAARVIGRIDGPQTTQRLIAMVEDGTNRQEACAALLSSRGKEAVSYVANAQTNPLLAASFQAASLYLPRESQPRS